MTVCNVRGARLRSATLLLLLAVAFSTAGCSSLRPGYETPTVTINSFRAVPSNAGLPDFEIGLRVINPNSVALPLRGVSYSVRLNGRELITGVSSDLPVIEGYSQGDVVLTATPNLFAGIRFITDLMNQSTSDVSYELEARLDVGRLFPDIRVTDRGTISLR